MTLTQEVLEDPLATSLASALAVANRHALSSGINALESRISVTQSQSEDGIALWRINYGATNPIGRRGGDFLVEVRSEDGTLYRILRGQ
jgi:hypothetical protein